MTIEDIRIQTRRYNRKTWAVTFVPKAKHYDRLGHLRIEHIDKAVKRYMHRWAKAHQCVLGPMNWDGRGRASECGLEPQHPSQLYWAYGFKDVHPDDLVCLAGIVSHDPTWAFKQYAIELPVVTRVPLTSCLT